jgi:hypothetical protein
MNEEKVSRVIRAIRQHVETMPPSIRIIDRHGTPSRHKANCIARGKEKAKLGAVISGEHRPSAASGFRAHHPSEFEIEGKLYASGTSTSDGLHKPGLWCWAWAKNWIDLQNVDVI